MKELTESVAFFFSEKTVILGSFMQDRRGK